jgi:hypothetical protein
MTICPVGSWTVTGRCHNGGHDDHEHQTGAAGVTGPAAIELRVGYLVIFAAGAIWRFRKDTARV